MYIILQLCEAEPGCRVISIAIHYFFTVCFMFMFLEAIHMYGLVASVVKMKGMLATKQNIVVREKSSLNIMLEVMGYVGMKMMDGTLTTYSSGRLGHAGVHHPVQHVLRVRQLWRRLPLLAQYGHRPHVRAANHDHCFRCRRRCR